MNDPERPTPEQMLARIRSDSSNVESASSEGKLRLFFGYAAGVGKTYAMLQAAQAMRREGREVVIGYVEPHARPETHALTEGLETISRLEIPYRGSVLQGFDLLALLFRNRDRVLTHQYLLKEVWGPGSANEPHYVRVFMANLRKKLERDPRRPQFLITEQGIGYRLKSHA